MAGAARGPDFEPDFDPRYDARFQRGWVDGGADGTGPPEPASADVPVVDRPVEPTVDAGAGAGAGADADAGSGPTVDAGSGSATDPAAGPAVDERDEPVGAAPTESEPPPAAEPTRDAEHAAELDAARALRVAFGIAWAIAVVVTLIGAGLVWSIVAAENPFGTPRTESDLVVRTLAQFAAPSLLSTGLLAIVALVVVDGVRRARRLGRSRVGGDGGAA